MEPLTEQRKKEIIQQTYKELTIKLEKLLKGMNTKRFAFATKKEKQDLIKRIVNLLAYRRKELKDSFPKILSKMQRIAYSRISPDQLELYFLDLIKLCHHRTDYFKVRGYERGKERGEASFGVFIKQ